MARRLLAAVTACLALTACSVGSVEGEIEGTAVPALLSAYFFQTEFQGYTQVLTVGVSNPDGCNSAAQRQVNTNQATEEYVAAVGAGAEPSSVEDARRELATKQVAYEKEHLPSDYWTVEIFLGTDDAATLAGSKSDIDSDEIDIDQPVDSRASICHVTGFPEENRGLVVKNADCWEAVEGNVKLENLEDEASLQVVADVKLAKLEPIGGNASTIDEDKVVGDTVVTINAGFCEPLQGAIDDYDDIIGEIEDPALFP